MTENEEVMQIVRDIAPVVMSAAVTTTSDTGTALRRIVGMMIVDYNMIHTATFANVFAMCLDLARRCNATLPTMDRVRKAALLETPKSLQATLTVTNIVRLTLAAEARIVSGMTFVSRDEVEHVATVFNDAFSQTEIVAADDHDVDVYMALLRLHGDVTQYLATKGRVLPRVIAYEYQIVMPSLRMAQLAYADPTRSDELRNENSVVHPAFMPMTGKMLAV